ncbi:PLP-dependent transferase [Rhodotorula sp. JG-1b]|nr:PLP-dependent transferase [Rhodotorula sp. JG-1b]
MAQTQDIDYDYFISESGRRWQPSAIRGLFPLEKRPGMVSFLAGKPNADTFPFSAIRVDLKPVVPGDPVETLTIEADALSEGLQYGATAGLPSLNKWLENLQEMRHKRPKDGSWRLSLGSGSQDLINKAFCSLVNEDDSIIMESPVYSGTLGLLNRHKVNLIEVPVDTQGLDPAKLEDTLANFSTKYPGKRFPKLLYTIPTGSNPTGATAPLERRKAILALVRKYNLLLLEDDAYHYLSFDPDQLVPSYFELEAQDGGQQGRVLRFDSFSKILSSGMRLGFVTGPQPLLEIIDLHTSNTNLQPSSTTQAMVIVLLNKWGLDGFLAHCRRVAAFYKEKRDMFEKVAHKYLDGLATWVSPEAGMFLFLDLQLSKDGSTPGDSSALISTTALEKGVLAVPGIGFLPNSGVSSFVRVSFSLATEEDAELGFQRLRECILEARGEKST